MKPDYSKLPDQPTYLDENDTLRFVENRIVGYMLELLQSRGLWTLNDLAIMLHRGMFTPEEYAQFSQLHGYSVSGFCELSRVPEKIKDRAWGQLGEPEEGDK